MTLSTDVATEGRVNHLHPIWLSWSIQMRRTKAGSFSASRTARSLSSSQRHLPGGFKLQREAFYVLDILRREDEPQTLMKAVDRQRDEDAEGADRGSASFWKQACLAVPEPGTAEQRVVSQLYSR